MNNERILNNTYNTIMSLPFVQGLKALVEEMPVSQTISPMIVWERNTDLSQYVKEGDIETAQAVVRAYIHHAMDTQQFKAVGKKVMGYMIDNDIPTGVQGVVIPWEMWAGLVIFMVAA